MPLNNADKKQFRQIGHRLKPIITIAQKGLTENIRKGLERALADHELIKIKVVGAEREEKQALIELLNKDFNAECVQSIGHVLLLFRAAAKPNPKLSNLLRELGPDIA